MQQLHWQQSFVQIICGILEIYVRGMIPVRSSRPGIYRRTEHIDGRRALSGGLDADHWVVEAVVAVHEAVAAAGLVGEDAHPFVGVLD